MARLQTQLQNAAEIRKVLQEVDVSWTWGDEPVDVRLIFLPCVDGDCDTSPLFEIIRSSLMTNFVFSHTHIEKRLAISSDEAVEKLFNKAVSFLSKKTAHGEFGELILFTLLDVYLEAPKILSKVSQKSSRKMPVYGADAVHAQYVDGSLRLYLGEAKLHKSFNGAATQAAKSISKALDNYKHEFSLIETHINFPEINDEIQAELLSALDPFDDRNIVEDALHSPCFIGFAEPSCFEDQDEYINNYKIKAADYIGDFYSKLKNQGVSYHRTTLLMLPFASITDVVVGFIDYMGIEK
ncbi:MAG: DUF1837 domain-containing protein [Proteobacteria bacterium]|nr:DUF1837 domain-containing protein [Pseudomonadota bacterium]